MIALLGANGRIGRHVAAALAERRTPARALVRRPDDSTVPIDRVRADLNDPATLTRAMHGASALLLLTAHGPDQLRHETSALNAAVEAGVGHIVKISGTAPSLGPNGPTSTAVTHWRSEQAIEASGLSFTFLRPRFMMQNLLEQAAPLVRSIGVLASPMGDAQIAMIDARDVAACAVSTLTEEGPCARSWELTGSQAISFPLIARLLRVRHVRVPRKLATLAIRRGESSAWEADHRVRMVAYLRAGCDGATTTTVSEILERPPHTIQTFLDEHSAEFTRTAGRRRTQIVPVQTPSLTKGD